MPYRKNIWKRAAGLLILGSILTFMGRVVYKEWGEIAGYDWNPDWVQFTIALLLMFIVYLMVGVGWILILRTLGDRVTYRQGLGIFFPSLLARYLPGGIWYTLGRVYLCHKGGLSKGRSGISILLEQSYTLVSALIIFFLSLPFWQKGGIWTRFLPSLIILPVLFIFLHPTPLLKIINPVLRWLGRPAYQFQMSLYNMVLILSYYLFFWVVNGMTFYFFISSFYSINTESIIVILGINSLAFVAGFFAIFTPAGLGVKEAAYFFLLGQLIPDFMAIGIAILFRLLSTVVEIIIIGTSFSNREVREMFKEVFF